jgi:tRNA pseudouridine55 synthase
MIADFEAGEVLLVDKPLTWTSFDVVKKLKYALKIKKIGHAGTLDPLATGLLVICTGKMTKQIDKFQGQEKEYTGKILLGKTTPSFDLETEFDQEFSLENITGELIRTTALKFLGTITQTPPLYSAVKIDGRRAYDIARKGENAEIKQRNVFIREFILTNIELPYVSFRLKCSKGTYVRSLARDLGVALGIGATLAELRRTKIGKFDVASAKTPADLIESFSSR